MRGMTLWLIKNVFIQLTMSRKLVRSQHQSRLTKWGIVTVGVYSIFLSACGGGSNGTGSSDGVGVSSSSSINSVSSSSIPSSSSSSSSILINSPSAYLFPTPASVTVSSYFFSTDTTSQTVSVSIQNPPALANFIVWQYSSNGISSVAGSWGSPNQATFTIYFKKGSQLSPGTYSDVLYIGLCDTESCNAPTENSLVAIPISYKVLSPTVKLSAQSINAKDAYINPSGLATASRSIDVSLSLTDFIDAPFMHVTLAGTAVQIASASGSTTSGTLSIILNSPATLGRGTFTSTASLTVCLDAFCTHTAPGSPFQISVTYLVGDTYTITGTYGFTWNLVSLDAVDIAWDAVSRKIFATESSTDLRTGYLTRVDPVTRAIDWRLPISVFPGLLQVSPDGLYAYVSTISLAADFTQSDPRIRKYRLLDKALIWDISVPGSVSDFRVSPGDGAFLVLTSSAAGGLYLYDTYSGTLIDRFSSTSGFAEAITWGETASVLFSYDTTNDVLRTFSPTSASFGFVNSKRVDLNLDQQAWSGLNYQNGLLMENHGAIYDVVSGTVASRLSIRTANSDVNFKPYSIAAALDMSVGRSYFWYLNGGSVIMQVFDINTGVALAYFPTASRSTFKLVRWGADGLAYIHSGNSLIDSGIGLVQGKFVAP